ncbi:hypothetical protein B1987_07030 [Mycobacterium kansasii]|uniref:PPE family protein n=1 Tax=Mycobacterium attenuatum TaxID=2341086 RepID=UPI000A0C48CD|nr:PPE family protein [Mycobacterium attenuatum]ORB87292.1 hypothetical protein B1987_06375 [Mycobacterium kansasii]ORB87318.1 hypothetical protein B1987_07030 [Mycobacterium kansasii]
MLDYGVLPPEINSARMYSGPGSASMLTAAASWEALAAGLESASRAYGVVISRLQGESWAGGASAAMGGAIEPYLAWTTAAGTQAEQAAGQARAAAAAYEVALAATVPPTLVTANRSQLTMLVATNLFGQNTTSIAATEADYEEMWAQDVAAMYGYAAASSAATSLTPFSEPPQTTNAAGLAAQSTAVAQAAATSAAAKAHTSLTELMSTVSLQLQTLAAGGHSGTASWLGPSTILAAFGAFNTLAGPVSLASNFSRTTTSAGSFLTGAYRSGLQAGGSAAKAITKAAESAAAPALHGQVVVSVGNAAPVGRLSVPQSWAAANPPAVSAEEPMWFSDSELDGGPSWSETPEMLTGPPTAGMGPIAGFSTRPTVGSVLRVEPRRFKMPRPSLGG